MRLIGCTGAVSLAKNIAKILNCDYEKLYTNKFPDGELYLRFQRNVSKENIYLIQSFYGNINDKLIEVIFAGNTLRDLCAKTITLVAPYFPYLRQDKRFNYGEAISIEIVARLLENCIDEIYILDPHLHRKKSLRDIFKFPAVMLSAYPLIVDYIKSEIKNPLIIGPDEESYKWAQASAEKIGCDYAILEKKRFSSRHVRVSLNKKIDVNNKTIVIVDDIISTGHTILETIKNLKKIGVKKIICICIHGIFIEGALEKIRKAGAKVISCNTIPNNVARIDVSRIIGENIIIKPKKLVVFEQ